jgi:hypothetical protein
MRHFVFLVDVAEEYVCFSHCCVTDDDEFYEVVVFLFFSSFCHVRLYIKSIFFSVSLKKINLHFKFTGSLKI